MFVFSYYLLVHPTMHFFGAKKLMGFALAILGECFWEYFQNIFLKSSKIHCHLKRCYIILLCNYMLKKTPQK
jgi:hypothetical protein